jgi:lipopolysaccharide/colanic/teichoic acid biosynthesis glycosyltransferase
MRPEVFAALMLALSIVVIVYHHVGYPLLLRRLAAIRRRSQPEPRAALPPRHMLPPVSIIVPAHNEASFIAAKIRNLAALDYPRHLLSIVIALDGCSDDTKAIAQSAISDCPHDLDIRLVEYAKNIGKVAVLNEQIAAARGDIVVLTDASAVVGPSALLAAAGHFADASVGVVCATYRLADAGSEGERAYWQYQTEIKADEAALAAPMGAHGAFYLFRRALWTPMPADTINDDFILPMRIVAQGYRSVYDTSISATELERTSAPQEFRRRVRIGAGNAQQALRLARLGDPRRGWLAFVFLSGKALRPTIPFFMLLAVGATVMLAAYGNALYQLTLAAEFGILTLATAVMMNKEVMVPKPLAWLGYLVEGHAASFVGALSFLTGSRLARWQPAQPAEIGYFQGASFIPLTVEVSKRAFDIICALGCLLVLTVLFIPIALAIKLDSRGPIFYRQLRVGRARPHVTHLFYLIKFRTMQSDAEAVTGPVWASKEDPRVTRVGRFLRKSRLDELPQGFNVLMGDMSVIGPRPERPSFFQKLEENIPFYIERTFGLRPGITGLAQVNQDYDNSIDDVRTKLTYDHAYAAHLTSWSSWARTDFAIILQTIRVMLLRKGQ